MTLQISTAAQAGLLNAIETAVGTTAKLSILTGTVPANVTSTDGGTVLVTMTLPSDWWAAAAQDGVNVTKTIINSTSWTASATETGTAGHFRLYANDGTTCHMQGTVGQGSGDLSLNNTSIASDQLVQVTAFTVTAPNN